MQLTRQLLGFGRQRVVARTVVDLNAVVSGMEKMLRPLLGEDLILSTDLAPSLGGVEADYGQMEQVVMNLTLNARDAMGSGGRLSFETRDLEFPDDHAVQHLGIPIPGGSYVMLIVSDTGHGMTPEVKSHLFEPFFSTKPTTQNTGTRPRHGVRYRRAERRLLWVEASSGSDTTFKICFPRVSPDPEIEAVVEASVRLPRSGPRRFS